MSVEFGFIIHVWSLNAWSQAESAAIHLYWEFEGNKAKFQEFSDLALLVVLFLHRNSINSAMKWLWKRSTPSDWVWAKHLYSRSAICRCLSFSTQHWETRRAILLCVDLNPTDWACLCVWVCARTCVCVCIWVHMHVAACEERACLHIWGSVYLYACLQQHTQQPVQKTEKATNMHTGDFNVCLLQQDWGLYMLVQRKKNMVKKQKTNV